MMEMKNLLEEVLSRKSSMKATTVGEEVISSRRNLKINTNAAKRKTYISQSKKKDRLPLKANYQGRIQEEEKDYSASSTSDGYKPNRKDYLNNEAYLKDMAEKAMKDLLNIKCKRTADERVNDNERVVPFIDEIMSAPIPSHVKVPTMKYHGTSDLDDHLMAFDNQMDLHNASGGVRCRLFLVTL